MTSPVLPAGLLAPKMCRNTPKFSIVCVEISPPPLKVSSSLWVPKTQKFSDNLGCPFSSYMDQKKNFKKN